MRRMELIVNSARVYGKVLHRGEIFEVPEKEALLWGALARAVPAKPANEYQTASISADDTHEAQPTRRQKNRYQRRDMRAEDE